MQITSTNTTSISYNPIGINGGLTQGLSNRFNFLGSSGLTGGLRAESTLEGAVRELYTINQAELTSGELRLLLISAILEALANRAKARRLSMMEAELALQFGLNAADKQRAAAALSFAGEVASASVQMVASTVDAVMAGVCIYKFNAADKAIRANADRVFARNNQDGPDGSSSSKKALDVEAGPPSYDECLKTPAARAKYEEVLAEGRKNAKATEKAKKCGKGGDGDDGDAASAVDRAQDQAKAQYINQQRHTLASRYDRYNQLVHAITTIMGAGGKVVGAGLQFASAEHNAQASRETAYGHYRNAIAQMHNDFAAEQLTYLRGVIELISSLENSRHQALGGVWGA